MDGDYEGDDYEGYYDEDDDYEEDYDEDGDYEEDYDEYEDDDEDMYDRRSMFLFVRNSKFKRSPTSLLFCRNTLCFEYCFELCFNVSLTGPCSLFWGLFQCANTKITHIRKTHQTNSSIQTPFLRNLPQNARKTPNEHKADWKLAINTD